MILENFKNIFSGPDSWLRLLLAAIFLSAGIFRIFNPAAAGLEMRLLGLPAFLSWLVMVLEIVAGLCLLFKKWHRQASFILAAFVFLALLWAVIRGGAGIFAGAEELFVFNLEATDFFLHFVFLVILVVLAQKAGRR